MTDRIKIKVKRLPSGYGLPLPEYQTAHAAGMDLYAAIRGDAEIAPGKWLLVPTGLSIEVPDGFEAQVRARSGLALKFGIGIVNGPGTIDADYRGEVGVLLINFGNEPFTIRRGDRIAQMVINRIHHARLEEVEDLSQTERSGGGFGHTGHN